MLLFINILDGLERAEIGAMAPILANISIYARLKFPPSIQFSCTYGVM